MRIEAIYVVVVSYQFKYFNNSEKNETNFDNSVIKS